MSGRDLAEEHLADSPGERLRAPEVCDSTLPAVCTGELVGITDNGRTPLVVYRNQSCTSALRARTLVDLHGSHVGEPVVLMFENGDPELPIVVGVIRQKEGWPLAQQPAQVEVEADGERMLVSAREQIVLRCGQASITLTKEGKVLIRGTYISSRSSGVNRIMGGSVQLN